MIERSADKSSATEIKKNILQEGEENNQINI